jgi:hypothetical protein
MVPVKEKRIRWFDAFMGLGYEFYEVRSKVILIFHHKKTLLNAWYKIIKWWPDDEIKMRFLETSKSYDFVLYGDSRFLESTWVFLKALRVSQHYTTFKNDYEGVAILRLALYRPKKDSYELELFDYKKRVTDVRFLKEPPEEPQDIILLRSRSILEHLDKGL